MHIRFSAQRRVNRASPFHIFCTNRYDSHQVLARSRYLIVICIFSDINRFGHQLAWNFGSFYFTRKPQHQMPKDSSKISSISQHKNHWSCFISTNYGILSLHRPRSWCRWFRGTNGKYHNIHSEWLCSTENWLPLWAQANQILALTWNHWGYQSGPPSPFMFDRPHTGQRLTDISPVTSNWSNTITQLNVELSNQKRCELMPVLQSAYRSGHSTESCLRKVMSDILDAADSGEVSLVGLLDLSAAFDTVDHEILLHRLRSSFGIGGVILDWIGSFLTNRTQAVVFRGERSSVCRLNCGVPQGSVLGPLLFILYTADVIRIAGSMGVKVHCYADDTQLYISGSEKDVTMTASRMIDCINAISTWMSSNRLKLNGDKTQFIWMGSRQRLMKIQQTALFVQGAELSPLSSVRDLGFIMDSKLTMSDHVSSVVRSCFFQLRQLRSVRHSLPVEARRSLIHCFISCRIDYCNANLYGISGILLRRLQTVLNAAARLVVDAGKRQHMTPIFKDLHWLPVKERILYKTRSGY